MTGSTLFLWFSRAKVFDCREAALQRYQEMRMCPAASSRQELTDGDSMESVCNPQTMWCKEKIYGVDSVRSARVRHRIHRQMG